MNFDLEAETRRLTLELVTDLTTLVCESALELVKDALHGQGLGALEVSRPARKRGSAEAPISSAVPAKVSARSHGKLELDPAARTVRIGRHAAKLTRTEFRIFAYISERLGEWVPSDEIRERVLGQHVSSLHRVDQPLLRVHVSNIRRKLGRAAPCLVSDRTRGLKLALDEI